MLGFRSSGLSTDFSIRRKSHTRFISSCRVWNSASIVSSRWRKVNVELMGKAVIVIEVSAKLEDIYGNNSPRPQSTIL